jgi:RHS repeat-associated protein
LRVGGQRDRFQHDTHGRLKKITDPAGGVTDLDYDVLGRLQTVTDPRNKVTSYTYNGLGDLLTLQSPDTGTTTYQYDAAGRRWKTIPADGRTSEVTFDVLDRPTQVRAWHPGQGAWQYADYGYDTCTYGEGRLCTVSSPGGWIGYAYTLSGELASELTVIEAAAWTAQHAYDVHGRRTLTSYTGGVEVSYGYDSVSYDWDGRVTAIAGSLSPQSLGYAWNAGDMITGITNNAYSSLSQTFAYDALSRLTGVTSSSGNHVLSYDANGNRTTHTWGGATDSYSVSSTGNRLNAVSATGTRARTYTHDAAGHRTAETIAGNTIQYVYDGFARPVSRTQPAMTIQQSHGATVSLPAGTWSYGHDGMGRRTFKRAPGNVLTRYLHGAEGGLVGETIPGGTTLTSIYLWLNGQPIGLVRGGQVYHVHADHLGRPEILTNASKAIVWRAENLAFDRKVVTSSIGEYNLGFPGQYYDAEGASWQNWFRTYDGSVGRYTQSDPIGLAGGLNTYGYVTANPVTNVDPSGLIVICLIQAGAGYVAADSAKAAIQDFHAAQEKSRENVSCGQLGETNQPLRDGASTIENISSSFAGQLAKMGTAVGVLAVTGSLKSTGMLSPCALIGVGVGAYFGDGTVARAITDAQIRAANWMRGP